MRHDEWWARWRVEDALGVPVVLHDDNSAPALFDFRIERAGDVAALEVVSATDSRRAATAAAINRVHMHETPALSLRGFWGASVDLKAKTRESVWPRVRGLPARLEPILRILEVHDVVDVRATHASWYDGDVREAIEMLASIGVDRVWRPRPSMIDPGGGTIFLTIELKGPPAAPLDEAVLDLVQFLWATDDVCRKLIDSGFAERHCFVSLNESSDWPLRYHMFPQATHPLVLPAVAPVLPPEITHLWIADDFSDTWHWSPADGWVAYEMPRGRVWRIRPRPGDYTPVPSRLTPANVWPAY